MLSHADADLVRRDLDLTGLAILLDSDAITTLLQSHLHKDLKAVRSTYLRYKPGTNCLVAYELDVGETTLHAYAKAFTTKTANKLRKFHQPHTWGKFAIAQEHIGVCIFPHDLKLKQLPMLHEIAPAPSTTLQTLHYKPERRYVALCTSATTPVVFKAYTTDDYLQAKANAQAFSSHGVLQIVPQLRFIDSHKVIVFEWLSQPNLSTAMTADAVALTGAALAELHAQPSVNLSNFSREVEAKNLLTIATDLSLICPQFGKLAQNLAIQAATHVRTQPEVNYPIHGDFNPSQVLVGNNYVTFLDFDRAGLSDRAIDLGSFIARLEYDLLRGTLSSSQVATLTQAFLTGYCSRSAVPPTIELYTAIALLRLAFEPFRYREPHWCDRTQAILVRAHDIFHKYSLSNTYIVRNKLG